MADDHELEEPGSVKDDDELSLPKATMNKLIQEMLPPEIACARETRDLLLSCCVEFIHLVSSEANEICEKDSRKTITAEHILGALKTLGFEGYLDDVKEALEEHKSDVKQRSSSKRAKRGHDGLSEEELLKKQQELLEQAREKFFSGS